MITRQQAHAQGAALSAAAKHSTVPPVRDTLRAQAREWLRAVADYDSIVGPPGDGELIDYATAVEWVGARLGDAAEPLPAEVLVRWLRPDLVEPADDDDGATIVLIGVCGPGMYAVAGGVNDDADWLRVIRVMHQGGQSSLHLEGAGGRDVYRNFMGPLSPVVVRA
jgi:hypothetical protein